MSPVPSLYEREERFACELARAAGAVVRKWYSASVGVEWKGRNDPVTVADREANQLIVEAIASEFPDDGILAEESKDDHARLGRERLWLVDPLDGTREFLDHNDEFVVMIALAHRGRPVVGAIYHPPTGTLYHAREGAGAWAQDANDRVRLAVSARPDLADFRLLVSRSHRSPRIDAVRTALGLHREEPCGSVGLKMARLALGQADLYVHLGGGTKEWDLAAPEILIREAGGALTDGYGEPIPYNRPDPRTPTFYVASNGRFHRRILDALAPVAAADPP